jgi:hypothetical protein
MISAEPNMLEVAAICMKEESAIEWAKQQGLLPVIVNVQVARCTFRYRNAVVCGGELYIVFIRRRPQVRCKSCKRYGKMFRII